RKVGTIKVRTVNARSFSRTELRKERNTTLAQSRASLRLAQRPPRSTSPEKTRRAGCSVAEPLPAPMYGVRTPPDPNPEREAVQLRTRTQTEDSLQKFNHGWTRMNTD